MSGVDAEALLGEFEEGLDEHQRAEARRLVDWLVADWKREAGRSSNPDAVHVFQREDLDARTAGRDGAERLEALRTHVLARRIDQLGGRTFALGKDILAGDVAEDDGRTRGEALRQEADSLAAELRALPDSPDLAPLRRELSDAVMEVLFAIEGKAMSARLARESTAAGPPDVH